MEDCCRRLQDELCLLLLSFLSENFIAEDQNGKRAKILVPNLTPSHKLSIYWHLSLFSCFPSKKEEAKETMKREKKRERMREGESQVQKFSFPETFSQLRSLLCFPFFFSPLMSFLLLLPEKSGEIGFFFFFTVCPALTLFSSFSGVNLPFKSLSLPFEPGTQLIPL